MLYLGDGRFVDDASYFAGEFQRVECVDRVTVWRADSCATYNATEWVQA